MTKKEIPKIDKDRFIESVYHIVVYGNTIRCMRDVLSSIGEKVNEFERMIIRYLVQSHILLMTISLLDELNKFLFKYNPEDEDTKDRVSVYKNIIEPILIEIDKWGDLRKFRNNVLAHNFRTDSDDFKSVHLSNKLKDYNIPEYVVDLMTLFKYLDSITKIAEEIFQKEYREAFAIVDSFNNKPKQFARSLENETEKVNTILIEVNKRIQEYNSKLNQ